MADGFVGMEWLMAEVVDGDHGNALNCAIVAFTQCPLL